MAGKTLLVTLNVKDNMSATLKKSGDGATKLGDALEQAGQDGKRGLDQLGQSAEANTRKMDGLRNNAVEVGAAIGTIVSSVSLAGAAYRDQERQIDGINALYGEQATAILEMSENIQDFTKYSNDAARDGALTASSLSSNYGLTADQIATLIERSADLATVFGIDLPDAVLRTSSALRGEGESAELLGLNMSDAAIAARALDEGITNWNVPGALTEAEKAAFRFTIFMEDTEATVGAAADAADNAGGGFRRLINEMQDGVQAAGGFLGPIGEIGAEMAPLAIAAPVVAAGIGKLAGPLRNSTTAARGLALATNPLALGLAAVTTAGIAWYSTLDDGESAFDRFSAGMDDLFLDTEGQNFFENIGGAVKTFAVGADEASLSVKELEASLIGLREQGIATGNADILETESAFRSADAYAELVTAGKARVDGLNLEEIALQAGAEGSREYEETLKAVSAAYSLDQSELGPYLDAQSLIGAAFLDSSTDADALQAELTNLYNMLGSGALTYDQYASSVVGVSQNLDDFTVANEEAAGSLATLADGANLAASAYLGMGKDVEAAEQAMAEAAERQEQHEADVQSAQQTRFDEWRSQNEQRRSEEEAAHAERVAAFEEAEAAVAEHQETVSQIQQTRFDEERAQREQRRAEEEAAHEERKARAAEFIAMGRSFGGFEDPLSTINLTGLSSQYSQLAEDIGTAGSALENTFRIIVSNTDAMGATAQATEDWILSLTQAEEGQSRLQEARSAGIITEQAYGAALGAQRDIQAANRDIQNDIVAIQANQAPLIADLTAQQAAYISTLAGLPEQQQLIALGWMDANTAAQANEAIMIAAAAANGEWGASGQAAAGQFIEGAIAANPVLEELLTDIGLVARDHEGNLVIDFAGAEGAQSEIAMLTESIDALTVTMGGVPPLRVDADTGQAQQAIADVSGSLTGLAGSSAMTYMLGDNTNAQGAISTTSGSLVGLAGSSAMTYMLGTNANALSAISGASGALSNLDGNTATVYINAINNAGGVIGSVASQLANLSGRTATTYVDTVYRSRGVGMSPYAHGGMVGVPSFAGGGMVPFWAGENGPELAHFAGGGTALLPSEGLYAAPPMTYISPNNAVSNEYGGHTFNISVAGGNREEIRAVFADEIVPEISRAMREYERGMGVA